MTGLTKDGCDRLWRSRSECSSLLGWGWDVTDGLGLGLVKLHKLGKIELGLLEDLDLLDEDVLEGEDLGALLGDLLRDLFGEPE